MGRNDADQLRLPVGQLCDSAGEACKDISGAAGTTLKLLSGMTGSTVRVLVTATNSGGSTEAVSATTSVIDAVLPSNISLPSISGILTDGQSLSTAVGEWSGTSPISYAYQWQECDSKGEGCKDIGGETGSVLNLVSSLVGNTLRVAVTATNSADRPPNTPKRPG